MLTTKPKWYVPMSGRFKRRNPPKKPSIIKANGNNKAINFFMQLIKDNNFIKKNGKNGKKITHTGKLTPQIQKNVLEAVNLGMPIDPACRVVGVTPMTYYNWLKWGEEESKKLNELLEVAVKELSEQGHLDMEDSVQMEEFVDVFIKAQKPNKFFRFYIAIEEAKAKGHLEALKSIRKAAEGGRYLSETIKVIDKDGEVTGKKDIEKYLKPDWNAASWYLERKFPSLYGQKIVQEGSIDHNHEHNVRHSVELPESIDRVADVLGILLGSELVKRRLAEHSGRELPAAQEVIDA